MLFHSAGAAAHRRFAVSCARVVATIALTACSATVPRLVYASGVPGSEPDAPTWGPRDGARSCADPKALSLGRASARAIAPTPNQQAYDVHYYDLDLVVDPATGTLHATALMRATVIAGPLSVVDLDLESGGMNVTNVTVEGEPSPPTHAADLLTVPLERTYQTGETFEVEATIQGTPRYGNYVGPFMFTTRAGQPSVWSLSEPFGAHAWWPCKDQADDKADSVDIRITLPTGMKAASNGKLVSSTDDGIHAVTRWQVRYPIAPYLVSIACYPYVTSSDWYRYTPTDSMEIKFFMFPDKVASAAGVNAQVKTMLGTFASMFGPYPFTKEKYGHANIGMSGGMEHQTCTSLGVFDEWTVCHEAAHQWWGDMVTCKDFHHIWLNESFATYAEALWAESRYGTATFHSYMANKQYLGPGTVYVPALDQPFRIFDFNLTYNKGAWVLHMLRHVVGDAAFFTTLQTYGQQFRYSNATTEDFKAVAEQVSGKQLDKFFQQWIYGENAPSYIFSSSSLPAGSGHDVTVRIQQAQPGPTFWTPIDVRIRTATTTQTFVVGDSTADQTFVLHVSGPPVEVTLDPDEWVLKNVGVADVPGGRDAGVALSARPNPASDGAEVAFSLARAGFARVSLVDVAGREVVELERGELPAGDHRVRWSGRDARGLRVQAGVYWLRLEQGDTHRVSRLAVVH